MNIWIVTTGSSDVQLIPNNHHWNALFRNVRSQFNNLEFSPSCSETPDNNDPLVVPARVMGMVYGAANQHYEDLLFPLLDVFSQTLTGKATPDRIFVILTDQSQAFEDSDKRIKKCPYWQDTCTLQPILEHYLQSKFPRAEKEFLTLKPTSKADGLDNWDKALEQVEKLLSSVNVNKSTTVYVSHQAGTPAISSAVQFVSLARFGKQVQFVVSNEYEKKPTPPIKSSEYLRGIQLQQAKGLIQSGAPGAAMKMLELEGDELPGLNDIVEFFNLNCSLAEGESEFDLEPATQRIADALQLIRIFLKQSNHLLGIALLAAAQETFLKVAILTKVKTISKTIAINGNHRPVSELVEWVPLGLFLSKSVKSQSIAVKKEILTALKFPMENLGSQEDKDFKVTNSNFALLGWLVKLEPKFKPWPLLEWSCERYRNSDNDLRNQLLHNLRGMEPAEVSKYLSGNQTPAYPTDVVRTYDELVQNKFLEQMRLLGLTFTKEKVDQKLQAIADSLRLADNQQT